MRVGVTGAAGFLGVAIVRLLTDRGHEVLPLDARPSTVAGLPVRAVDIRDVDGMVAAWERPDVVVHAAGVVGVAGAAAALVRSTSVNVLGSVSAALAARAAGASRILLLSSDEVYGETDSQPVVEDSPCRPTSAYGTQKLAAERLAGAVADISSVSARVTWAYGPGFPRARPPQPWIDDARHGGISPRSPGADHRADLVYVDDVAIAVGLLTEATALNYEAYNIGAGRSWSLRDVSDELRALVPSWHIDLDPGLMPGISPRGPVDTRRIHTELGWAPTFDLQTGLEDALRARDPHLSRKVRA
ncbi:MAG: NAD-dependent epimerase/dehydratase family protein [Nostocoides sp.]